MYKAIRNICVFALITLTISISFAQAKSITIGTKTYSEQFILAELAKILLEEQGYEVTVKKNLPTAIIRKALENNSIDFYFEYTGTAYTVFYKQKDIAVMTNSESSYQWIKEKDAEKGLIWLDKLGFNNTNAIMIRKEDQDLHKIYSLSDLSNHLKEHPEFRFAVSAEFYARADGYRPLSRKYTFPKKINLIKMDFGLIYKALKDKSVDAGLSYSTDGRIASWGFVTLIDDLQHFPVYYPAAVIRSEILNKHPDIAEILKPISEKLTMEDIQKMNAAVDIDGLPVAKIAKEWVDTH